MEVCHVARTLVMPRGRFHRRRCAHFLRLVKERADANDPALWQALRRAALGSMRVSSGVAHDQIPITVCQDYTCTCLCLFASY